jgi:hypothetical protein
VIEGRGPARLVWPVLGLGVLAVLLWLLSYSWLVGVTPPTRWISRDASPWWISEVAAVAVGALALLGGLLLRTRVPGAGRAARWAAGLGAFALVMSAASLAWPA